MFFLSEFLSLFYQALNNGCSKWWSILKTRRPYQGVQGSVFDVFNCYYSERLSLIVSDGQQPVHLIPVIIVLL